MPLAIYIAFNMVLLAFEYSTHLSRAEKDAREMDRYQYIEHPRRNTSDRYLDRL